MYAWLWRKLPFGLPGKISISLGLAAGVVALLWLVIFPRLEPILPFDDVQVGTDGVPVDGGPGTGPVTGPGGGGEPGDGHDIPYDTESNNPLPPSPTR